MTLSTNNAHRILPDASHAMVVEDRDTAPPSEPSDPRRRQLGPHQHADQRPGGLTHDERPP